MLTTTIYDATKSALVNRFRECAAIKPEFTKQDDPHYLKFKAAVDQVTGEFGTVPVRAWKLFSLWWISRTFRTHWNYPCKETMSQMIWGMFHFGMTEIEIGYVVLAWMRWHGRRPSKHEMKTEIEATVKRVGKDAQASVKRQRDKRNARRRKMNNPTHRPKGRPKQTDGLRGQILELLRLRPCTPAFLAATLDRNANTVRYALFKMKNAGEIVANHGMYDINTEPAVVAEEPVPKLGPVPAPSPKPERRLTDEEWIAQNLGKWTPRPTLNYNGGVV